MLKPEPPAVEKLARKPKPFATARAAVLRVAADRMFDGCEVHTDLVRASGLEPHPQQRGARQAPFELEVGHGLARAVGRDGVELAVAAAAADGGVDRAAARVRRAAHEREVGSLDLAALDLLLERAMHGLRLGHHHEAGGVAVEAMD